MTTSTNLKTFKIAKGTKAQVDTAYNNNTIADTDFAIATDEDYISEIKTINNKSLVGSGNINLIQVVSTPVLQNDGILYVIPEE